MTIRHSNGATDGRVPSRGTLVALAVAMLWTAPLRGAAPEVLKVEPPNWWAGDQIRLLIRGRNLQDARLTGPLKSSRIKVSSAGTYVFADLSIPPGTAPGLKTLRLTTTGGAAAVPFEVTAPLSPTGRFQGFGPDDVIYLMMPDRFSNGDPSNDDPERSRGLFDRTKPRFYHGGDLQGIIGKLPYLHDLGVTAIWLTPVYDNNDRLTRNFTDYHGYGAVDFYNVDEHLGSVAKLRELVDAAHTVGIKVIQDQVANHTGPAHPWVADPPAPDWFNGSPSRHLSNSWQTWTQQDPYATPATTRSTLEGWFANILPDLNQNNAEVRRYIIQNALWWIGMTGIDGIREDTVPYVPRDFWKDWTAAIRKAYPNLRVVGEVFDEDPALVASYQHTGIDTVLDFPLYFAIRRAFAEGRPVRELPKALAHDHLYRDPSVLVTMLGLHDVRRFMSVPGATLDGLKLAFTVLMTTRGTPLIYYGDEIAMEGGDDPDNRSDFPQDVLTHPMQTHIRKLAQIRRNLSGPLRNLLTDEQQYVYSRGETVIAINNAAAPVSVTFETNLTGDGAADLLDSGAVLNLAQGRATVQLAARSAAIFSLKRPR